MHTLPVCAMLRRSAMMRKLTVIDYSGCLSPQLMGGSMLTLSQKVIDAINDQINNEFNAAYSYLALIAYFEDKNLDGFAHWMRLQWKEEEAHAMRLFNLLLDHGVKPELQAIAQPRNEFGSMIEAFEFVVESEATVTKRIMDLYELCIDERAHSVKVQVEWFITEQVEEEKTSRTIYEQLQMIGDDSAALLVLDRELAGRSPEAEGE